MFVLHNVNAIYYLRGKGKVNNMLMETNNRKTIIFVENSQ